MWKRLRFRPLAEAFASAFLAADAWTERALVLHGKDALGYEPVALRAAAKRALARFDEPPRAHFRELVLTIEKSISRTISHEGASNRIRRFPVPQLAMGQARWPVPPFATSGELARWLDVTPNDLEWLADSRGLERRPNASEALRHYRYAWAPKRSGGLRLLEAPKPRTKEIQRRILRGILDRVPSHVAAHGFVAGRSPLTHARLHVRSAIVLRIDLADFFLHVTAAHVRAIFAALGYPDEVAWMLTCLTTNVAPVSPRALKPDDAPNIAAIRRTEMLARTRHLPQGAPTSPALANLAAFVLDVRLSAAADRVEARYSRYADDLVFSGNERFARGAEGFAELVAEIARDEGFAVNRAKTRFMRTGARKIVTGVVVNERPTIARREIERLEAILFNCARSGPDSQNRDRHPDFRAHLRGRVAHVAAVDRSRASWLEELFDRIVWS